MIRAWRAQDGALSVIPPEEAARDALAGRGMVWMDFDGDEDGQAVASLLAPLGIHPLAVDDMVMDVNRPKVDDYGVYLYLAVHSARWDGEGLPSLREIDLVVGPTFLVTYHDGTTRSVTAAQEVLARRPELLGRGPAHLVHFLLDVMVDNYLPIVDRVSEEVDELEELVFTATGHAAHERILRLKRAMAALRRIVGPQRDAVLALTRDEFHAIPAEVRPYLRDVYDRLARVSDLLDSFRDEIAALLELHVSLASNRLNEVIKILTVIATIMLPLTVVTSYYGMNFRMPEFEWPHGWLYALGLLVAPAGATWWVLRRRRWY
jgi:magnesium transporter